QTAILLCDFETFCNDFIIDNNWGFTDGLHPQSIDHDHTLNTSSGHYSFYICIVVNIICSLHKYRSYLTFNEV
ncbi:unnamed protein product, partial [Rotaria sordida]